jgi:hypothetical protein
LLHSERGATLADTILILPAVVIGLAIGIYEAILMHRDVTVPTHRFGHTIHAIVMAIIAVFITMNTEFVVANVAALQNLGFFGTPLFIQIVVGVVMIIKIHGVSRAISGSIGSGTVGLGETWAHSLIIGALCVAAPYVWPLLAPVMPAWLGGTPATS